MANDDNGTHDDDAPVPPPVDPPPEGPFVGIRALDDNAPRPPYRGWTKPPTEEKYAAMWAAYRDGARTAHRLKKQLKLDVRIVETAIKKGWPEKGWPALEERYRLFEKQAAKRRDQELADDKKAAEQAGKTEGRKWKELSAALWPTIQGIATILAEMENNLRKSVKLATLIKYRDKTVLDKDGKAVTISEAYVDGSAHARAVFLLASSAKDLPAIARAVLGPAAAIPEAEPRVFSIEELDELAKGRLPKGITMEMVGLSLMNGGLKSKP